MIPFTRVPFFDGVYHLRFLNRRVHNPYCLYMFLMFDPLKYYRLCRLNSLDSVPHSRRRLSMFRSITYSFFKGRRVNQLHYGRIWRFRDGAEGLASFFSTSPPRNLMCCLCPRNRDRVALPYPTFSLAISLILFPCLWVKQFSRWRFSFSQCPQGAGLRQKRDPSCYALFARESQSVAWSEWWGSNPRPPHPKCGALSTELHPVLSELRIPRNHTSRLSWPVVFAIPVLYSPQR